MVRRARHRSQSERKRAEFEPRMDANGHESKQHQNMNTSTETKPAARGGLSLRNLTRLLGDGRRLAVLEAMHRHMEYGVHHFWAGADEAFTAAGLRVLAQTLGAARDGTGEAIVANEAKRLDEQEAGKIGRGVARATAHREPIRARPYKDEDEFFNGGGA